jgi:hypothetical protein
LQSIVTTEEEFVGQGEITDRTTVRMRTGGDRYKYKSGVDECAPHADTDKSTGRVGSVVSI